MILRFFSSWRNAGLLAFLALCAYPIYASNILLPRASIIDSIPSSCTQACEVIATSLDSCDWGSCLCNQDDAQALESCMNCLYGASPTQDIYNAAQGTFSVFEDMCSPALNVSLNVVPISSSATSTTTISSISNNPAPSSSSNSTSDATSSLIVLSTSTSLSASTQPTSSSISPSTTTSAPTASQGVQGPDYGKQKCALVVKDASKVKRSLFQW